MMAVEAAWRARPIAARRTGSGDAPSVTTSHSSRNLPRANFTALSDDKCLVPWRQVLSRKRSYVAFDRARGVRSGVRGLARRQFAACLAVCWVAVILLPRR
jgi:hypothetical protein